MSFYVLNDAGEPVVETDATTWAEWLTLERRVLARDIVGDTRISTVFMGIDHSFTGGLPLLWETMIFGGEYDDYQERYTSRADALAGHAKALAMVQGDDLP